MTASTVPLEPMKEVVNLRCTFGLSTHLT